MNINFKGSGIISTVINVFSVEGVSSIFVKEVTTNGGTTCYLESKDSRFTVLHIPMTLKTLIKNYTFSVELEEIGEDFIGELTKFAGEHFESIDDIKKVELENLYLFEWDSHMLFSLDEKPMSMPIEFSYIEGFEESVPRDSTYRKLFDKVKVHPYTLFLEEEEIPYYNRDFIGQKGVDYGMVYLPQEVYEKLYAKHYAKGNEYPSVSFKEAIRFGYDVEDNLYGDEITNLLIVYREKRKEIKGY